VLRPRRHVRLEPGLGEAGQQGLLEALQHALPMLAAQRHLLGQLAVGGGIERLERQVLELALDARDAEPVRERGVDVARLAGDALRLVRRQVLERAHVVQPVGELDEDDAQVARHGEQHLAEVLGLLALRGVEREARDLRHSVDELRHLLAVLAAHVAERDGRVLDRVVEERGARDRRVEVAVQQVDEDVDRRHRVRDVGHARLAELVAVRGARVVERLGDARQIHLGRVAPQVLEQLALEDLDAGNCAHTCFSTIPGSTTPGSDVRARERNGAGRKPNPVGRNRGDHFSGRRVAAPL
jgi:hypothetical protein